MSALSAHRFSWRTGFDSNQGWLDGVAVHRGAPPPLDYYFQLIPLMGFIWSLVLRGAGLYRIEAHITLETVAIPLKSGADRVNRYTQYNFLHLSQPPILALGDDPVVRTECPAPVS